MTIRNHSVLTPRERQVLDRLLLGETTRSIADSYGLSRQTVKNYVTVIYEKLGVRSRADLTHRLQPESRPRAERCEFLQEGSAHAVRSSWRVSS